MGIFILSASGGSGNPSAKGMGYHEVTFYVA